MSMKYREQLKYIKSHGDDNMHSTGRKKRRKQKRQSRREEKSERLRPGIGLLWCVQAAASVCMIGSMLILGILPEKYMVVLTVVVVFLLIAVKGMQASALRGRKRKNSGRKLSVVCSILFFILAFYALKVNGALDKIATGEESGNYTQAHAIDVTQQPFNIYISGIDVYGEITQDSRSDVNLIAAINPQTHKILLVTTPRDYYVPIPGISDGQNDKLTHAGIYGIDASVATLENLYDTNIPFYVRVNFTSVEEIVNVMGGVDVESELAFTTGKESGEIVEVQEGRNHFNGKEALAFVRERHALADGDNQRGKNQQALMTGLIKKVMSPMILFRANGMINSVVGNAETNMAEAQIKSLIRMQLDDMKGWEIESMAASGDSGGQQYCYSYDAGPLYVTVPDWGVVGEISAKMQEYLGY